ncbi:tetratricopeptide repeat protein [Methylobacterium sp. J-067]|uniref:tetratricopeptide repeat protein n=1 Tax=Methylobacterium sp. J-067 TaxID=2836648 RepID=UPI001FBAE47C|nr:tetratricopeptide repeat protein [Methylobacterium sp. J-067]MCJ2023379.1 tetratricopeptide repeat protein [Methylobacterium sp. J-067]
MVGLGLILAFSLHSAFSGGLYSQAREAPPEQNMERCKTASEASDRVAACTTVINNTRDKSLVGRAYNRRGHTYVELKNYFAAARDFAEVARLNPTVGGYQDNRANALRLAGRYDEALEAASTAIRLAPGYAFVVRGRALIYEEMGRLDQALADIDRGITIDPRDAGLRVDRGRIDAKLVRDEDAIRDLTIAIEMDSSRTDALRERGLAYIRAGRTEAAMADLKAFVASHPEDTQIPPVIAVQAQAAMNGGRSPLIINPGGIRSLP